MTDEPSAKGSDADVEIATPEAFSRTIDLPMENSSDLLGMEHGPMSQSMTPTGQRSIANRYEIIGLLGSGGMGNVYKVRDTTLDEIVALKTLRHDLEHAQEARARFLREVKLARLVTHQNVARTFDIGVDNDLTYLTMEFVEGEPLSSYFHRRPDSSLTHLLEILVQVARGLEAAHGAGVIHRDLKPANVMISNTGRAVVTDFGIARSDKAENTIGNGLVGTPLYMSPEQVEGKETIDLRADVYAFGVMLYELLDGAPPWNGDNPLTVALARLLNPPPRLSGDHIPEPLEDLVLAAMARHPEDRPHNMGSIANDLEVILGNLSTDAVPAVSKGPRDIASIPEGADTLIITQPPMPEPARDPCSQQVLAVLPFANHSSPEDEYMVDCLTEEVLGELSMSRSLLVKLGPNEKISSEGALARIGRQLGVDLLVTGSLRRMGERVRVRVALVSVEDGFQIWGEKFMGEAHDLFQIAEDASKAIANSLCADVCHGRPEALTDPVAIDLYMRARHASGDGWYSGMEEAIDLFRRARERAGDDPRILTGLATALSRQTFFAPAQMSELLAESRALAERAIHLAPDWPDPHYALAIIAYNERDHAATELHCRRALLKHPDHIDSLDLLGRVLSEIGPLDEARRCLERVLEINEHFWRVYSDLMRVNAYQENWSEVDRLSEMVSVMPEDFIPSHIAVKFRLSLWRGEELAIPQDPGLLENTATLDGLFLHAFRLAILAHEETPITGEDIEQFLAIAREEPSGSQRQLLILQVISEFASFARQEEHLFETLTWAVDVGLQDRMWLEHAKVFSGYRETPRFQRIVERVALAHKRGHARASASR